MAHTIKKHDPSQPPPVVAPRSSYLAFAIMYGVMCLVTGVAGAATLSNQTEQTKSAGLGVVFWMAIIVFGLHIIMVLIAALSFPLYKGERWAFEFAFFTLLVSPVYLFLGGAASTLPPSIFYVIGTLNLAMAGIAFIIKPPVLKI